MSLIDALLFPFKKQTILRILLISFVLLSITWLPSMLPLRLSENRVLDAQLWTYFSDLLIYIFISGYGVLVIANLWQKNDRLPDFELAKTIPRGVMIVLAFLLYLIPALIIFFCIAYVLLMGYFPTMYSLFNAAITGNVPYYSWRELEMLSELRTRLIITFFVSLPFVLLSIYSAFMAYLHFIREERYAILFDYRMPVNIVLSNMGMMTQLFIRQLCVGLIYALLNYIFVRLRISLILAILDSPDSIVIVNIVAFALSVIWTLIFILSLIIQLHLLAQFGFELGLHLDKSDDSDLYVRQSNVLRHG